MTKKILTIISHEFTSKIKSKGFLIATFVAPIAIIGLYGLLIYLSLSFDQSEKKLLFVDSGKEYISQMVAQDPELYALTTESIDKLKEQVNHGTIDGYVSIPEDIIENGEFSVYTSGGGGTGFISKLKDDVGDVVEGIRIKKAGIDQTILDGIFKPVSLKTNMIDEQGNEQRDETEAKSFIGIVFGFLMYMLIFIYGGFVSRGVVEEKSNRIVEIIASSAKPIDILMGKIVGIGALGITQILMWLVLISVMFAVIAGAGIGPDVDSVQQTINNQPGLDAGSNSIQEELVGKILGAIDLATIVGFIFFFIAGYFIYSAMFAALGAAVDNEQDVQQLQLPLTVPIFISLGMITPVSQNPDGLHSIIFTMFPLTSPILMPARMAATNVPLIEVIASAILLVLGFLGILWVSAKIYRIGILSTGKRPSFKELWKWIRTA